MITHVAVRLRAARCATLRPMTVLTLTPAHRSPVAEAFDDGERIVVVALCAAWCDTCVQFGTTFARIAAARPAMSCIWLDIEDDSAVCGDVDVENFPTLAVFRGTTPLHFGVSLPHEGTVARLIDALAQAARADAGVPDAVRALPAALRAACESRA